MPHLIVDYSPTRDILTRAAPLLWLILLGELTLGLGFLVDGWFRVLAFVAAVAIMVGLWVGINRLRGRANFADPSRFGIPETVVFVLLAPAIALVSADSGWVAAAALLVGNLLLLGLIFLVTSYGLVPLGIWALFLTVRQLRTVLPVVGRILPTLLLFSVFMFLNAEMWKVAAETPLGLFLLVFALLALLGGALTWLRLPAQVGELAEFADWREVVQDCGKAPCSTNNIAAQGDPVSSPPLSKRERFNVNLLLFTSQVVQALIVGALVTALYVGFGLLTITTATFEQWVGAPPTVLGPTVPVFGVNIYLSVELLKTAGFIGAIGGLQFLATALADRDYQREFFSEVREELRQVFAVRAVYRASLPSTDAHG